MGFKAVKVSAPVVIALVVVAELMLILVAPLAYFTFLAPKPEITLDRYYPLSDSQIRTSWPNLPSAQEIVDSGHYAGIDTAGMIVLPNSTASRIYLQTPPRYWDNCSLTFVLENRTEINAPGSFGLIPRVYHIYLQLNQTNWIVVSQADLVDTAHPPKIPPEAEGFLGTDMPEAYGYAAVSVIPVTVALCLGYLVFVRRRNKPQSSVQEQGEIVQECRQLIETKSE